MKISMVERYLKKHLVLLKVGLHKYGLVSRDDDHPLGPVLGVPVPHVENYQVNDGCEGESEDKAADSDEKCGISAIVKL